MRYIVFPERDMDGRQEWMTLALASEPTRTLLLNAWGRALYCDMQGLEHGREELEAVMVRTRYVFPSSTFKSEANSNKQLSCLGTLVEGRQGPWCLISNGWYVTQINARLLAGFLQAETLTDMADMICIKAAPVLIGYHEKVLTTLDETVVGIRRFYEDTMESRPDSEQWPHHLLIKQDCLLALVGSGGIPAELAVLKKMAKAQGWSMQSYDVAGHVYDLCTENGFLLAVKGETVEVFPEKGAPEASVLMGEHVTIDPTAVIVGPTVIGDQASIARHAIVAGSVVLAQSQVAEGECLLHGVYGQNGREQGFPDPVTREVDPWAKTVVPDRSRYRIWPTLSYAGLVKRVFDVLMASFVLLLFAPVFPIIGLLIKLDSKGPVFYRARRQGRYGKEFGCLKFRTMRTDADSLQEELRQTNEVDGPQFKIADDPRISRVGHFLRETYVDEIPQFLNVLWGQMSVVGPRPSPKAENTLCPWWRDVRLSVRPGVTGMWQVKRTREPGRDFQEWIQHDSEYVRSLSLMTDVWIVWKTALSMLGKFAELF